MNKRLNRNFYNKSALVVAPSLIGKILVRKLDNGDILRYLITETECYYGEEDTACHARFGKTKRNAIMYEKGGYAYIYMCYGLHYLLNVATGSNNHPEAVLIRAVEGFNGPAKLTKAMNITKELNGVNLIISDALWIEDSGINKAYYTAPRVGINYATEPFRNIHWRFIMKN